MPASCPLPADKQPPEHRHWKQNQIEGKGHKNKGIDTSYESSDFPKYELDGSQHPLDLTVSQSPVG